jgi:hypothetical protein
MGARLDSVLHAVIQLILNLIWGVKCQPMPGPSQHERPWDEVDRRGLPFGKALAKIELNKND